MTSDRVLEDGMVFNEESLGKVAKRVRDAFIADGTSPTEEVVKIANEYDLTIEQVKRVCEESNRSIKVATKATDPQLTFPVADYTVVLEDINMKMALKKEAEVKEEEKEELFGYGGVNQAMPKTASVEEVIPGNYSGSHKALFLGVKRAEKVMDERLMNKEAELRTVVGSLLETLYKEAREKRTLNNSYSNLMKCATTPDSRNKIHDFYHWAVESLSKAAAYTVVNTPLGFMDKTASMIDPGSTLIRDMNSYITLRSDMDKLSAQREILSEKIALFSSRATEEE